MRHFFFLVDFRELISILVPGKPQTNKTKSFSSSENSSWWDIYSFSSLLLSMA
jgi:hypothetical protein